MSKKPSSPKWESASVLSQRALMGDTQALIQLSKLADQAENDTQIEEYVEAFDRASVLYAMGGSLQEDEWLEFCQVIAFAQELQNSQSDVSDLEDERRKLHFEIEVLQDAVKVATQEQIREKFETSLEAPRSILSAIDERWRQRQADVEQATILFEIAKKKLKSPRFTSLPDAIFDELIETVGYELDRIHDSDEEDESEEPLL